MTAGFWICTISIAAAIIASCIVLAIDMLMNDREGEDGHDRSKDG